MGWQCLNTIPIDRFVIYSCHRCCCLKIFKGITNRQFHAVPVGTYLFGSFYHKPKPWPLTDLEQSLTRCRSAQTPIGVGAAAVEAAGCSGRSRTRTRSTRRVSYGAGAASRPSQTPRLSWAARPSYTAPSRSDRWTDPPR